ncbi:MAG TPA: hypothetical protein PLN63_00325 [Paludibacteraceae bacterium]|nr:hypothetical protein [Paludibacteraceae bacterium]
MKYLLDIYMEILKGTVLTFKEAEEQYGYSVVNHYNSEDYYVKQHLEVAFSEESERVVKKYLESV